MIAAAPQSSKIDWFTSDLPRTIPSLDGMRAVSIGFVVLSHAIGTAGFPVKSSPFLASMGGLGVRIFFVISGLLITTLLLKERTAHGAVSLRDFYARRFFRIFPASYSYIAMIGLLVTTGFATVLPGDFLHAVTYTTNYHAPHGWLMGHLWSLSVEEQFYLLWPALIALTGPARAIWFAGGAVLVVPLLRFASLQLFRPDPDFFGMQFHLCCDALAIGCLLAILHRWLGQQNWYLGLLRSRVFFLIPLCGFALNGISEHPRILALGGYSLLNLCIALTLDRLVRFPGGITGRVVNSAGFRLVGVLSYSLYLWQQVFVNRHGSHWLNAFPVNVIAACVAALASYTLIERPFLRLKSRFSR